MKYRLAISITLFSGLLLFAACVKNQPSAEVKADQVNQDVLLILNDAATLMDSSAWNDASSLIRNTLTEHESSLTLTEKYYLYSFEAEIFYYSALTEPGINSALKAREVARKSKNQILEGSSENFLGLFYLNKKKYREAINHFRRALNLIPENDSTIWISRRFHVFGNLGECYLGLGNADSAKYYSRESFRRSVIKENIRAQALACWNISEAFLIENLSDSAEFYIQKGLEYCNNQPNLIDAKLFLLSTQVQANKVNSRNALQEGLSLISHENASDFSRIEFIKEAISFHEKNSEFKEAYRLEQTLNKTKENLQQSEDSLRLSLLENYYINENRLRAEKEKRIVSEFQIEASRSVIIALISLSVALLSLILMFRFRQKQKNRIRELKFEKEKEELRIAKEAGEYKTRLEAIDEERNRIARELHDDIGSSMSSLNIFAGLALENEDKNPEKTKELLLKIKEQSGNIAENISDLIWAVYTKNDTYGHLIQRMKNFCFEILGAKNIDPVFNYPPALYYKNAGLEVRKNILLIFKEAVNNIAKYSKAKSAEFTFELKENVINLIIKDNGIGFDESVAVHGNGMNSMRARARAMKAQIFIQTAPGQGTRISISFTDDSDS
ncbi:MAG: histidine kinase [Bacteroidia bacterium]